MRFRRMLIWMLGFITFLVFLIEAVDVPHYKLILELIAIWFVGLPFVYFIGKWELGIKEVEEDKEQSRRLLSVILKGSPAAILFVKNRKAIWVSKSIESILGWPVEKWLTEPSTAFCYPSREQFEAVGKEIIYKDIARKGQVTYEYDYVHKNGRRIPTVINMQPLNRNNLEEGFIFSIMDNTERKKREEMLRKVNQSLEEKVKERAKELAVKIKELEKFRDTTVERELRMKELRDEIERLKKS